VKLAVVLRERIVKLAVVLRERIVKLAREDCEGIATGDDDSDSG